MVEELQQQVDELRDRLAGILSILNDQSRINISQQGVDRATKALIDNVSSQAQLASELARDLAGMIRDLAKETEVINSKVQQHEIEIAKIKLCMATLSMSFPPQGDAN